jgi:hypothetical protein
MKTTIAFICGAVVGALGLQVGSAEDSQRRGVNHIGISTGNYDKALAFYKNTLGAKEAFTIRTPKTRLGRLAQFMARAQCASFHRGTASSAGNGPAPAP